MGNTLNTAKVNALFDELEKEAAGQKVVFSGLREMAKRLSSGGFGRGWSQLSPTNQIRSGNKAGNALSSAVSRTGAAEKALQTGQKVTATHGKQPMTGMFGREISYDGGSLPGKARAYMASKLRAGTHLAPDAQLSGGVKGLAERASRGGWTGEGAITKYLPVGQKGFLTMGATPQVMDIGRKATGGRQEGEPGIAEDIGSLAGFTLPAIRFGGMPNASLFGSLGGLMAGGTLGRKLDEALDPKNRASSIPHHRFDSPVQRGITKLTHGNQGFRPE